MALLDISGKRVPWHCEGLMSQCRGMPGQGSRSGWVGEHGEGGGWIEGFQRGNQERE